MGVNYRGFVMNKKKERFQIVILLAVMIGLISLLVCQMVFYINYHQKSKTPLQWCVWEIYKHEGYDDCAYVYQEVKPDSLVQSEKIYEKSHVYAYIITTYIYPIRTEWFCFIECYHKLGFDNAIGSKQYSDKEVVAIDCDEIYSNDYG